MSVSPPVSPPLPAQGQPSRSPSPAAPGPRPGVLDTAAAAFAAGRPVLVTGCAGPVPVQLVADPATAGPAGTAWLIRHGSGLLTAPLTAGRAVLLGLPPMSVTADSRRGGPTVTVDAATGIGTGISAVDRARTLRVLADPGASRSDLTRPGHVMPVVADDVPGPAGTALALLRLARGGEVAVATVPVDDRGEPLTVAAAAAFAVRHRLVVVDAATVTGAGPVPAAAHPQDQTPGASRGTTRPGGSPCP
ncbi:hypothetical protein GCM10009613_33430 [Pseudonocardia kongjuensis]|uniref:3,4-dihydroxy-2-butanone-4-phosphate synthase n=1 Tax=Pseudonocardia kongjuensis TaxID=102227 RepID=A0ABN1XVJ3_9PSEU